MAKNSISKQLRNLIIAYWTPERIELWHKYEKTDQSIPWHEYEHIHRKRRKQYEVLQERKEEK